MTRSKTAGLAVVATVGLMALLGAGTAAATVACKTNTATGVCPEQYSAGQSLEGSLRGKTTALEVGTTTLDTCTGSTFKGKTTNSGGAGETVKASIEELTWSGCTKTTNTLEVGSLEIHWISGTDNGTVTAKNFQWTIATTFGSCVYGWGAEARDFAKITGGSPAKLQVTAEIPKISGNCPGTSATWTASFYFTAPKPLYFSSGESSAGALCKTNTNTESCSEPYFGGQSIEASLTGGTSVLEIGSTVLDTCTGSTFRGKTTTTGTLSEAAKASIEELTWNGCTRTTTTLETGSLEFDWIPGTDNAKLTASHFRVTLPIFGSCVYGYGDTPLEVGTVTAGSPATIVIDTEMPKISGSCSGTTIRWTATYSFTEPEPLYFSSGGVGPPGPSSVLCKTNTNTFACSGPYSAGQALEGSLTGGTATLEVGTTVLDTCTGSTFKGKMTSSGGAGELVEAAIEELTWSGCTRTTKTLETGFLEFEWIAGTDNATVTASGTEWTVATIFGSCVYGFGGATDLGTVTGGNPAAITLKANIKKLSGPCPGTEALWTASYTFTEPKPLYFTEG